MKLTRKKDNFHWTADNLLSYNKTFNYAVSGRGPGKTTNILQKMMRWHQKGLMLIIIKRQIVDISDTTLEDLANAYNILQEDENKISLHYKRGDLGKGIVDVFINDETEPFFRLIALSNPKYRLKGLAFDRPIGYIIFDEYKISGTERYLKDEYSKFQELYATLARFGVTKEDGDIIPPRVIFLGNNYSLTDPYMSNMKIPIHKIKPGQVLTGDTWAFEDIKINDELREYLLKQNPLFQFGDDAYNKYALEGVSVSDQRINVVEKQPDYFKLNYVFYIENKYLGVYYNTHSNINGEYRYWIGVIDNYNPSKRNVICFDFSSLVDGVTLFGPMDRARFQLLQTAFRFREIAYKSIYEGYLFEQIYDII